MSKREERLQKKYPNTSCFTWYNANPKGKLTTDCVIRAITYATKDTYANTVNNLAKIHVSTGYDASEPKNYGKYLESLGYVKMKQPRKSDNTKYTGWDFCRALSLNPSKLGISTQFYDINNIVAHLGGHHIVAISDKKVVDTWDSTLGTIGNFWIKMRKMGDV